MREDKVAFRIGHLGIQMILELGEVERGKHANDDIVVSEIEIERLVEREIRRAGIQRRVLGRDALRGVGIVRAVRQTVQEFLHPADTLCAARGGLETVISLELEVQIVLVPFPLGFGKERAEIRVAQRDGFVRAEGLHAVYEFRVECQTLDVFLQTGRGVLEVDGVPDGAEVGVSHGDVVGILARVVRRQRVVRTGRFDDHFEIHLRGGVETEKAEVEESCRVQHALFGGRADHGLVRLSTRVVEFAVLVEGAHTAVEELEVRTESA